MSIYYGWYISQGDLILFVAWDTISAADTGEGFHIIASAITTGGLVLGFLGLDRDIYPVREIIWIPALDTNTGR